METEEERSVSTIDELKLVKDGETVAQVCLDIVAFAFTAKAADPGGFLSFYETFRKHFGGEVRWWQDADMKKRRPVDADSLEMMPFWMSDSETLASPLLGLYFHSGPSAKVVAPPMLNFHFNEVHGGYPMSQHQIVLPSQTEAEAVVALVNEALMTFPLLWGHAGYTLYWDELDYDRDRLAKPWTGGHLKRHPGLWSQSPIGSIACRLYNGLQSVSWLTFLGSDYTEKLGGKDALQAQLEGAAEVSPLGQGGCLIKAGDAPELGDVNRQDILPSYRAVWSALEPVRADEDALAELWVDGMEIDDMQAWFKRFEQ